MHFCFLACFRVESEKYDYFFSLTHPAFTLKLFFLQVIRSRIIYQKSKNTNYVTSSHIVFMGLFEDNNPLSPSVSVIWASHKHERWAAWMTLITLRLHAQPVSRHKRAVWTSTRRDRLSQNDCTSNLLHQHDEKVRGQNLRVPLPLVFTRHVFALVLPATVSPSVFSSSLCLSCLSLFVVKCFDE